MDIKLLLKTVKQSLSIIETATAKDEEIKLLIEAAEEDLKRQGIEVDLSKKLIVAAIVMFVKANFGNVDIKEKQLAQNSYSRLCENMGLSQEFKLKEEKESNA